MYPSVDGFTGQFVIYDRLAFLSNRGRMIVWLLDLQLPSMQSVPIITNVVSLNPAHSEVYNVLNTTLCDKVGQ
jgi:hypothetical protein